MLTSKQKLLACNLNIQFKVQLEAKCLVHWLNVFVQSEMFNQQARYLYGSQIDS